MRSCPHCLSPYTQDVEFCGIDGTRIITTDTDPLVGNDVDRYRILQHIGDGGMARVYRVRHHVLDRELAMKVLFGEFAANKTLAERFRREAQTMSRITHDNVVEVTDFGRTAHGLTFLAMELVRGQTLRRIVKTAGPIEPDRAARIARQIALGLDGAHALGFVHRDLKPGNVMVIGAPPNESVKILDFGLARMADDDNELYLTRTGQFLGTPIYMAPEQIVGADVDHRADLYALGVVLFEMLEGHPPFVGNKIAHIREKHLSEQPARVRASGGLEDLVSMLLAKSAVERPSSARAVVATLDALADELAAATSVDVRDTQRVSLSAIHRHAPSDDVGPAASAAVEPAGPLDVAETREVSTPSFGDVTAAVLPGRSRPALLAAGAIGVVLVLGLSMTLLRTRTLEGPKADAATVQHSADGPKTSDEASAAALEDDGPALDGADAPALAATADAPPRSNADAPTSGAGADGAARSIAGADASASIADDPAVASASIEGADAPALAAEPSPPPTERARATRASAEARSVEPAASARRGATKRAATRRQKRLDSAIDAALRRRGLLRSDLARDAEAAAAYRRWRAARRGDDMDGLTAGATELVDAIERYPVDAALVDRRLRQISDRLQAAAARAEPGVLRPYEDRYLALAAQLAPRLEASEAQAMLQRANVLLIDVRRIAR